LHNTFNEAQELSVNFYCN